MIYKKISIFFSLHPSNKFVSPQVRGASVYLVHSSEHLSCVGDSLHRATEDVQRQLQPLQDRTALTVQTQALQCLKTHTNTHM